MKQGYVLLLMDSHSRSYSSIYSMKGHSLEIARREERGKEKRVVTIIDDESGRVFLSVG